MSENVQRTLVVLKPDAVQRGIAGELLARFERRGLRFAALRLVHVERSLAERHYADREWDRMPPSEKWRMAHLLHVCRTRPHFVAYAVKDLPAPAPLVARWILGMPLVTWTIRGEDDRRLAARWADQMIFEAIRP